MFFSYFRCLAAAVKHLKRAGTSSTLKAADAQQQNSENRQLWEEAEESQETWTIVRTWQ